MTETCSLVPIGTVHSPLPQREQARKQGFEAAPDAWLEIAPAYCEAAADLRPGQHILVLTWLHRADRSALAVHPRDDQTAPLTGVFSTRSQDRPNRVIQAHGGRTKSPATNTADGAPVPARTATVCE